MILQQLESQRLEIEDNSSDQGLSEGISSAKVRKGAADTLTKSIDVMPETEQMSLFAHGIDPTLEELKNKIQAIDPNQLSPMQALLFIDEWKKMLD